MAPRLESRVAIVTGASSGIGRAIALRYASEGATVIVADRDEKARSEDEANMSTAELIQSRGGKAIFVQTDVTNRESVESVVKAAVQEFGRLDIMVNNAGIGSEIENPQPVWRTSETMWNSNIAVNCTGVFHGVAAATRQMVQQEPLASGDRGWIVNMSSVYGQVGIPGSVSYTAAKHAVVGLTKTAALDCAPFRVHVNAICPGFTHTALTSPLTQANPQMREKMDELHPFGGPALPDDIAKMAVVLGSDDAGWMTGAIVPVDGGYLAL